MSFTVANSNRQVFGLLIAAPFLLAFGAIASAEEKLSEPIYRVASETPAAQSAATTPVTPPAGTATTPAGATAAPPAASTATPAKIVFDLVQKPGEHPLVPVLRVIKLSQEEIDNNIRDYSCTLVKQERVDGELGEKQHIFMKVMHQPFSVYMSFLQPYAGREVLYVAGQNNGQLTVLEAGFKRMLGKVNLDPVGTLAMRGQKHPITSVGMRNLTDKLTKIWEAEAKFAECEVTTNPSTKVAGRSATMVQIVHPIARQDFHFHAARLFFDNELKIPIHFDAYLWPAQEGGDPPLEESYTYTNLKINNGFTAGDFDSNTNPDIFKK